MIQSVGGTTFNGNWYPGSLLSTLQHAFRTESKKRLKLTQNEHHFLNDVCTLAADLLKQPTRIAELVPRTLSVIGTTDAFGSGMGGNRLCQH